MSKHTEPLEAGFIDAQKQRLLQLKAELTGVNSHRAQETASAAQAMSGQAREYEEDAQHLTEYELSGQLSASVERRLGAIDRALEKITEGNYGQSDLSGEPIGMKRLEVLPDAVLTKTEQQASDSKVRV